MLINADCLDALKQLPNDSVDSLITDPPYGIAFMGKSWDNALPSIDIWKEVYRVMKPGAFGFICCIPRQDCLSRMMISLEDAGFNINFTSLYWTYASGFPKSLHIGKAIDKRMGKERPIISEKFSGFKISNYKKENAPIPIDFKNYKKDENGYIISQVTGPASPEAAAFEGSYAGFQPKPAVEVIIVVMKPRSEPTYVDQALKNGKGVVWFDDCRIPWKDENEMNGFGGRIDKSKSIYGQMVDGAKSKPNTDGRFPANLLVSDDVLDDVSRFYSLDAWAEKNLPFLIVPKASKSEKNTGVDLNKHPTVKPIKLMSYLITLGSRPGDVILDPFAGSGTTGCAAIQLDREYILIEKEVEYFEIIKVRIKYFEEQKKNQVLKI